MSRPVVPSLFSVIDGFGDLAANFGRP